MNKIRQINYLSLDFELNTDGNKTHEICEVGVAVGNKSEIILTDSKLIKIKQPLFECTTKITGITQEDVNNGLELQEVATWLSEIINTYQTFVNPVIWGLSDAYELLETFKNNNIHFPHFGRRVIDVKHFFLFIEAANGRALSGGLKHAMNKHKIKFDGKSHRAEVDAENTLRFFFHLLNRQSILEDSINTFKAL